MGKKESYNPKTLGVLRDNTRINTAGTDDDTTVDVQDAINQEGSLSLVADNIVVSVEDEIVTLRGNVHNATQKMMAGDLAAICAGEDNVDNRLVVDHEE